MLYIIQCRQYDTCFLPAATLSFKHIIVLPYLCLSLKHVSFFVRFLCSSYHLMCYFILYTYYRQAYSGPSVDSRHVFCLFYHLVCEFVIPHMCIS